MHLKDIKYHFFFEFIIVFTIWIVFAFLGMGYEDGTDYSDFGKMAYAICGIINFSSGFWSRFMQTTLLHPLVILVPLFSIATTSFLILIIIISFKMILTRIYELLKPK